MASTERLPGRAVSKKFSDGASKDLHFVHWKRNSETICIPSFEKNEEDLPAVGHDSPPRVFIRERKYGIACAPELKGASARNNGQGTQSK